MKYQAFFKCWCWKNWQDFKTLEPSETRSDGINGVYAFRMKNKFGRLKGESRILYIGKVEQNLERKRSGILYRLMNYQQKNGGASKRLQKIAEDFGEKSIEYAYEKCATPRDTEKALLESYYETHLEFPPLNRSA